jgi:PAS domain S-box-containing protein
MSTPRILIVEDDAILAAHLEDTLIQLGYQVTGLAATGSQAVKLALKGQPDAILMDIRLRGEMTGIQAAEQIHKKAAIPVVYLTAYTDEVLLQQAKATDAYAYLSKPVRDRELRASLEMALYKHSAEQRLAHLTQVLRAVRNVNQLITRERDPRRLLDKACQIVAHTRGYVLVWIGQMDEGSARVKVVAHSGRGYELLQIIVASGNDEETSRLPSFTALRTGEVALCQDVLHDECYAPWKEDLLRFRFRSAAAVPILHENQSYGVLCVQAGQSNAFDEDEIGLLKELAGDLAFALKALDEEATRLRAEEALRQAEMRYRALVEQNPAVIYTVDPRQPDFFVFVSQQIEALSGYSPQAMIAEAQLWINLIHPEDRARVLAEDIRTNKTGAPFNIEYRLVHRDGHLVWVHEEARLLHDASGQPTVWQGFMLDITERKLAEGALRASEEHLRLVTDNMQDMIVRTDLQGLILYASPSNKTVLGYDPEYLVGKSIYNFMHPEDIDRVRKEVLSALRVETPGKQEYRYRHADGHYVWLESAGAIIFDESGSPSGAVFSTREITERKQAEQTLRESENRFHAIFEQAAVGVAQINSRTGEFVRVNQKYCGIFGFSRVEMLRMRFQEISHPADLPGDMEQMQKLLAGEIRSFTMEKRHYRSDESIVWLNLTVSPMWAPGEQPDYHIAVIEDITERKRAEEALRESENRLHTIVEGTQALLVSVDANGHFTYANDATARALGYASAAELIGKSYLHFIHPEDRQQVLDTFINQANTRQPSSMQEFRIIDIEDKVKWFSFLSDLLIKDGKVVGQSGVALDITERKQAESQLNEQIAELQRWHNATLGRESRVLDLKREVNELLGKKGQPPRYPSAEMEKQ